ncbi:potassium-transporting ATPase subunit KdpA [Galactobacter valiniphilus]|uniref:Potassium-transporting ATPase potassium-binding subunit n=1 Tax=Galactobacter valiniphilus TaxID=2676122 RepID=A0A399J7B5_9MICC|nr:potassium-transporting ATPase subunit KdpA [Galactobacter valiniphilus]RII41030.1 potassium-transporting ATPase subunit KdpA [Galactobacter valiniphilus]
MSVVWATAALGLVILLLAAVHVPLGDYMARVYSSPRHLRVERWLYRATGVNPDAEQSWRRYLGGLLAFSALGLLAVYALQRLQAWLPGSLGLPAVEPSLAFNTAASFLGNTNWQSYSPEATVGLTVQMAGLAVQNFLSAAVGLAVAIAFVRGLSRRGEAGLGNVWVDLVRGTLRLLLPIAVLGALLLLLAGVIQNLNEPTTISTLTGAAHALPGGPVASQEAIKMLGTNGGGFFNANSAHPFENPNAFSNLVQILLVLIIPFSLPRTFGTMVGSRRQGVAILAVMSSIFLVSYALLTWAELSGAGAAPQAAGGAMEGKEQRFGIIGSTLFATTTTGTSTGAVNSMHDSYTALGGALPLLNMMLGEVAPGGVGSGLYGMLILAIVAVFVAGLLVGRTPEYLGKRIGRGEITLASLYLLVTPTIVLLGTALSFGVPALRESIEGTSILNPGHHGLTEVLYAFTSAANNNGSAFAGLTANTPWLNWALGLAILLGRFLPIVLVLALAGRLAAQRPVPVTAGTLPTHTPLFQGMLAGVTLLFTALTYFPVLALGPLAEGTL